MLRFKLVSRAFVFLALWYSGWIPIQRRVVEMNPFLWWWWRSGKAAAARGIDSSSYCVVVGLKGLAVLAGGYKGVLLWDSNKAGRKRKGEPMANINCFINLAEPIVLKLHSFFCVSLSRVITTVNVANPEFSFQTIEIPCYCRRGYKKAYFLSRSSSKSSLHQAARRFCYYYCYSAAAVFLLFSL